MPASRPLWKLPIVIAVSVIVVIALFISLRLTFLLQIMSFNSNSNEPTIPANRIVFTSTLKKPKLFDFIAFRNTTQPGSSIWIFRVCGMAGDIVEMRNGDLFVNGKAVDSLFSLSHSYLVFPRDTVGMHISEDAVDSISDDRILINYSDKLIRQHNINYDRYIIPSEMIDAYIQKVFHEPWNMDHFGPLKVPQQSFFVLGDNRSGSVDSRYIGFINGKDFKGTVISY